MPGKSARAPLLTGDQLHSIAGALAERFDADVQTRVERIDGTDVWVLRVSSRVAELTLVCEQEVSIQGAGGFYYPLSADTSLELESEAIRELTDALAYGYVAVKRLGLTSSVIRRGNDSQHSVRMPRGSIRSSSLGLRGEPGW